MATDAKRDDYRALYAEAIDLQFRGRLLEAESALRHVLLEAPDIPDVRHALGVNLLAQGRYHEGWLLYEARTEMARLRDGFPKQFPFPRWQGESLAGKRVTIFPEQGFGDQIQFVRFVPMLIEQGASVTLFAPPPLARLFAANFPDANVVLASGKVEFDDPDYWLTMADLPGRLDIGLEDINPEPYIRAEPVSSARVGFMGQGDPAHIHDRHRSLPADVAAKFMAAIPDIVSLDPAHTGARDFADTAAIIAGLDVVVSVDTSVAHLAGAMGKPCILLLSDFGTDWRWGRKADTTQWYPNHRLFRNEIGGDWAGVVASALSERFG